MSPSLWEKMAKSYISAPPGELVAPPRGNPGSATGKYEPNGKANVMLQLYYSPNSQLCVLIDVSCVKFGEHVILVTETCVCRFGGGTCCIEMFPVTNITVRVLALELETDGESLTKLDKIWNCVK